MITIYSVPNCVLCVKVKNIARKLETEKNIDINIIDFENDLPMNLKAEYMADFVWANIYSFPVVRIDKEFMTGDEFLKCVEKGEIK